MAGIVFANLVLFVLFTGILLDVMAGHRDGGFGIKGYRDRGINTAELTVEK